MRARGLSVARAIGDCSRSYDAAFGDSMTDCGQCVTHYIILKHIKEIQARCCNATSRLS